MTLALILIAWLALLGLTSIVNVRWVTGYINTRTPTRRDLNLIDPVDVIGLPRKPWR